MYWLWTTALTANQHLTMFLRFFQIQKT